MNHKICNKIEYFRKKNYGNRLNGTLWHTNLKDSTIAPMEAISRLRRTHPFLGFQIYKFIMRNSTQEKILPIAENSYKKLF